MSLSTAARNALTANLKEEEGLRLKVYKCIKKFLTIGYGRNLETKGITPKESEYLLQNDIDEAIIQCERNFPNYEKLTEARKIAILDMCYNMGIDGLLGFKKMMRYLEFGLYNAAAHEILDSQYARDVGKKRSRRMFNYMLTGEL